MKAKIILINWLFSFTAVGMPDMERSSIGWVIAMLLWFTGSCLLLRHADKRGWMKDIVKRYKLNEL